MLAGHPANVCDLDLVDRVLQDFLGIANRLLCFAFSFFQQTFGLLLFATDQFTGFGLNLTDYFFYRAFDLIFVHE